MVAEYKIIKLGCKTYSAEKEKIMKNINKEEIIEKIETLYNSESNNIFDAVMIEKCDKLYGKSKTSETTYEKLRWMDEINFSVIKHYADGIFYGAARQLASEDMLKNYKSFCKKACLMAWEMYQVKSKFITSNQFFTRHIETYETYNKPFAFESVFEVIMTGNDIFDEDVVAEMHIEGTFNDDLMLNLAGTYEIFDEKYVDDVKNIFIKMIKN